MEELTDKSLKPVALKTATGFDYFDYDEIILFKADGHNVECMTIDSDSPVKVYHSLVYLEKKYCNEFLCRCNKSTIVNLKYLINLEIKTKKLHLKNNLVVKISDDFLKSLKDISVNQGVTNYKKRDYENGERNIFMKLKMLIIRLVSENLKAVFNKDKPFRLFIYFIYLSFLIILISQCESPDKFFRPNLPEKLCSIGIVDLDDTTLRHISFEKSFQSEYPDDLNDSLRNFSFSISSPYEKLFTYRCDSTVKSIKDLRIPDNIMFNPGEKYYLNAREKNLQEISAEVIASEPPSKPELISTVVLNTTLTEPAGCGNILDVRTAIIKTSFKTDKNLYYAILVKGWGYTLSSGGGGPWPGFMDFSVKEGNTPGFLTELKGLITYHYFCDSITRMIKEEPTYAYFIEGEFIPGSECIVSLSIQYKDGHSLFEFIKAIGIKVISIPKELYHFEKSVYTYRKTSGDPFAEPVYLNGNIKGGNGIFALCRSRELKIIFSPWI